METAPIKPKKKWLYEFTAKNGETEHKFALSVSNRKLRDLGDEFYTSTYSKLIRKGILPRAVFKASIENMGTTVSDSKQKSYDETYELWASKTFALEQKKKDGANASDLTLFEGEIAALREKLVQFQVDEFLVYQNTAEAKAQQKTITWFALHLSYESKGVNSDGSQKYEPLFQSADLEEKLDEYDELIEDEFYLGVMRRIHYLVTLWFLNGIEDEKEFADLDKKNIIENSPTNLKEPLEVKTTVTDVLENIIVTESTVLESKE